MLVSYKNDTQYTANLNSNSPLIYEVGKSLKGYKIAFGNTENIYMMNPDGSNIVKLADAGPVSGYVSWGPNAEYIYYASAKGRSGSAWEAWRVNIRTKESIKISNFGMDVRSLGVSPDNQTLAVSVMTGNSNIDSNNDLSQYSTNLYTVQMSLVEAKIKSNEQITMKDLTVLKYSLNSEQFWYEELSWNHDKDDPILAYTKTWRYDEDNVSYTDSYTIQPNGDNNKLIAKNKDQPIWSIDNTKLTFLDLSYYDLKQGMIHQINVNGISNEVSGGSLSPLGGKYLIFEIGDEPRFIGVSKVTKGACMGEQLTTNNINVYEPRWSPKVVH